MKYLFAMSILFGNSAAFAAPVSCQSNDENVGGGNIQIWIESPRQVRDLDGHFYTSYPVTASNQSQRIRRAYDGRGTVDGNRISLTLTQEGDIAVGTIEAKLNPRSGMLIGRVSLKDISAANELISCVTAQ